jgi:prophage regulatory protein
MESVEYLIRLPEVMRQCGLSKAAVYAYMKRGDFPQNTKLGARCSAWSLAEVQDWVRGRISRRGL